MTGAEEAHAALAAARRYVAAGLSVKSLRLDGSKAPMFAGTEYQRRLPLDSELSAWFSRPAGVGIICGAVSGNHEVMDLESDEIAREWAALVEAASPGLLARIPRATTGGGGKHWHYRLAEAGDVGIKLARDVPTPKQVADKHAGDCLAEYRGEGQYVAAPGSPLSVHETGFPYLWDDDGPEIEARPILTMEERDVLHHCAALLDRTPQSIPVPPKAAKAAPENNGAITPWDDFNARADFAALLVGDGWTQIQQGETISIWRRPGKDKGSGSATLGHVRDKAGRPLLRNFSSNAPGLETRCYDPAGYFAATKHGGDFKAAAKALRAEGYGAPRKDPPAKSSTSCPPSDTTGERVDVETGEVVPPPWPTFSSMDVVKVPPFPLDALPGWLGEWAKAVAYETQTQPDLAGTLGLAAIAAAVAGKYRVKPSPRNARWTEPLNLYVAVVQGVATRKSPVFRDAFAPFESLEREMTREAAPRIARADSDRKVLEKRLAKKQAAAADGDENTSSKARYEAGDIAEQLAGLRVVASPKLRIDDATPEALALALQEQGERILVATDEGGALFEMIVGRYDTSGKKKGGAKCELYLKAHQGGETSLARIGRAPVHLVRPALTIATTIQPDAVRFLAGEQALRGLGVLARFLWCKPENIVGKRKVRTHAAPEAVVNTYNAEIRRLFDLPGNVDEEGRWVPQIVEMDDAADDTLADLAQKLEPELAEGCELAWIGDWAGKLEGACARLAGLLFLALGGQPPERIPMEVVESARKLADFYLAHAQATFHGMGDSNLDPARAVWAWARKRERFTAAEARDALRNNSVLQPRVPSENPLDEPLDELVARGYLRILDAGGNEKGRKGRPTTPSYEVRPELQENIKSYKSVKSDQFSQNGAGTSEQGEKD